MKIWDNGKVAYDEQCRTGPLATRAYSVLEIKSFDEERREFSGVATTPSTDLMEDIVESKGGQFNLPIPLLWQHDKERPVGHITHVEVTEGGIKVRGNLVRPFEGAPPTWAERLNVAWADMKTRLVRGLSIGFKPLQWEPIKNSMGYRYTKWSWLELSPVTIAANMDASITAIKSIAMQQERAASGQDAPSRVVRLDSPAGVTAKRRSITPQEGNAMNVSEQIRAFEAKRMAMSTQLDALLEKAAADGCRTLDENEQKEHDELDADVARIDQHLENLHAAEARQMARAKPVDQAKSGVMQASRARDPYITAGRDQLPPGVEFARFVKCVVASRGIPLAAYEVAKSQYPDNPRLQTILKAAVAAGTTSDVTWAAPLVEYQQLASEFIEFLRPQTILGKFGTNGIPALNPVPFNVRIPRQTTGGQGYWVGQGKAKPLTKFDFDSVTFDFYKVANIAVLTDELVRFSNPSADTLTRNALAAALRARLDIDFIDPAKAAVANVSPASITNGITGITSSGTGVDGIFADLEAVMAAFGANNLAPNVAIMSSMNALALSMLRYPLSGAPVFGGMSAQGGSFNGLPVIVSEYVTQIGDTGSSPIVFLNTNEILLADDGTVTIDASNQASLEMSDAPAHNSHTPTGASLVSMWQTNSVALKAERYINWLRARDEAVVWIDAAAYTSVPAT